MLGVGEAYLVPYGIFLGLGTAGVGLLASLPLLCSSLAQLVTVRLLDRVRGRRCLVVGAALVQALSWLPMLAVAFLPAAGGGPALLLLSSTYFALGGLMVPAWSSWIGDLVPRRVRGRYFGRREQLRIGFQFAALVLAGAGLHLARRAGAESAGFLAIFVVAFVARLISAGFLGRMSEPLHRPSREEAFTFGDFLRRTPRSNFGRFTIYIAVVSLAVHVAGPFFAVFMLRDLGFTYAEFTASSAAVLVAQVMTFRHWGRLSDRFGNRTLLRLSGWVITVVPVLWVISTDFVAILAWQLVSGVGWAGFNLAAANFLFDAVSPPKRARCLAYHNLIVAAGTLVGASLGGWLAAMLPPSVPLQSWQLVSSLQVLFLASAAARMAAAALLLPAVKEVRPVPSYGEVIFRVVGLAASRGMRLSVLGGLRNGVKRRGGDGVTDSWCVTPGDGAAGARPPFGGGSSEHE